MSAISGHSDIWNELIGRISEPHCLDIASNNINSLVTFGKIVMLHCGTHCIGIGLHKDVK